MAANYTENRRVEKFEADFQQDEKLATMFCNFHNIVIKY